jgi:hypothetical protein
MDWSILRRSFRTWQQWCMVHLLISCCSTAAGCVQSGILYPVVVRFENQNYAGVATNNFGLDEVEPVKK